MIANEERVLLKALRHNSTIYSNIATKSGMSVKELSYKNTIHYIHHKVQCTLSNSHKRIHLEVTIIYYCYDIEYNLQRNVKVRRSSGIANVKE